MSRFLLRLLGAAPPGGDAVPDAELLRRYTATGDAAAFELLVRRHADAVWAACARVLRHEADADDAFQTTFLVLARKASSVRGSCAGGWLHRVAVNAALKLKASGRREPAVLTSGTREQPAHAGRSPESDDLAAVHEELARLPDHYRLPVVLCDLEGYSRTAAAKVLGWPPGSVAGRLSRARDLLRTRLARRGIAPALVLTACAAPSRVVSAAVAVASGSAVASPVACSLTEGVLSAMRVAKLKFAAVVAVGLVGVIGFGFAVAGWSGQEKSPPVAGQPDKPPPVKPAEDDLTRTAFPELEFTLWDMNKKPLPPQQVDAVMLKACPRILGDNPVRSEATDDTYRRLLKGQLEEGRLFVNRTRVQFGVGRFSSSDYAMYFQTQHDMRHVATELWATDRQSLIQWLEEFVLLAKETERFSKARVEAGTDPSQVLNVATRHRLAAEAALWKAKNRKP